MTDDGRNGHRTEHSLTEQNSHSHTHHSTDHSSHHHHSSHRNHRRHRHKTESLSRQRRLGRLKYLLGATVLAFTFAVVMIVATVLEKNQQVPEGTAENPSQRLWSDADTVDFDQGLYGFDHRMESFLFVGTDNSGNEEPAEGEEYHGAMADFLLLMVLDYTDDTYGFLQLDRNTITEINLISSKGEPLGFYDMQLCTAHWYGKDRKESAENTVTAVSTLLGYLENIRGYYILNMEDVGIINSAVGGVQVTIEDDLSTSDPDLQKGKTVTLTDEQAERFLRARMSVGGGTNVERMARQRDYMSSFFAKVRDLSKKNAAFYNQLWNDIHTTGFTNMNGNAFSRIANMLLKGENKGVFTLDGIATEGQVLGDGVLHEEFYPSETAVFDVMNTLYPLILIEDYENDVEEESDSEEDLLMEIEELEEDESETEEFFYEYETGIDWEEDETDFEDETDTEFEYETGESVLETIAD